MVCSTASISFLLWKRLSRKILLHGMCFLCGAMATCLPSILIFAVGAQLPLSNLFFIHFWGSTGAVGSGPSQKWVIYGTKSCIGSHIWRPADTSGSWSNRLLCTFLFSKKSLKIELFKIGMFELKNIKILAFYIHAPVPKMPLSYLQVSKSNDKPFLNRVIQLKGLIENLCKKSAIEKFFE